MAESTYFITVEGRERGPYTVSVLRKVWNGGLLAPDVRCRAPDSNLFLRLSEVLGIEPPGAGEARQGPRGG